MWKLISICLLFSACADQGNLGKVPPTSCFSGDPKNRDVGECRSGKPTLDENYNITECVGEILPAEETCDGKDQNCSGFPDDYIYPLHPYDFWAGRYGLEEYPCLVLGECRNSVAGCIGGNWICSYPPTVELPTETRCDGLDNSCNGRTDENLFQGQYCYSGPIGTEINPPCHPGVLKCEKRNVVCENEILPSLEVCGDFSDNDCDGIIDNTATSLNSDFDIVFIVDTSGSMQEEINAVAGALSAYATQFDGNENYKFAFVIMSYTNQQIIYLDKDLTDFAILRARVQILRSNGIGFEASLDSMYMICDNNNPLILSWRPGAKRLSFIFTDEPPQTYSMPPTDVQMIADSCIDSETNLFIWSMTPLQFRPIAESTGGLHFDLTNDWETMFDDMNNIIFSFCAE